MSAANHAETISAGKKRVASNSSDSLLSSVDEVGIDFAVDRKFAHSKQTIFGLKPDRHVLWNIIGDKRWNTDAEVDIKAILQFKRGTLSELIAIERHFTLRNGCPAPKEGRHPS